MSVADTVNSIISETRSLASYTANVATAMAQEASSVLDYQPKYPSGAPDGPQAVGISYGNFPIDDPAKKIPSFPSIRTPSFPTRPALTDIDTIVRQFTAAAPDIELPDMKYRIPSAPPAFTEDAPVIDSTVNLPTKPNIDPSTVEKPTLGEVTTDFTVESISVPDHNFSRPRYTPSTLVDWSYEFSVGQSLIPNLEDYATQLLDRLCPGLRANYVLLGQRINDILSGRETALTNTYEQALYDRLRARIAIEKDSKLQVIRDVGAASGWALPGGALLAARMKVETETSRSLAEAALEVYAKRAERELQHLQFVMELASKLYESGLSLFTQALGLSLEAFKAAIAYADAVSIYSKAVYELKQKDFEIYVSVMQAEITLFEALLKAELAKIEVTKAKIEVEKLKSDLNQQLLEQYTTELKAQEVQANVYATEVSALRAELEARKFPLDLYGEKVKAYVALVEAKKVEYGLLETEISADKAKVEGQLAKLKVYQTDADIFRTEVDADSAKVTAQAKRNESVLDEYKTLVQTEMNLVQTDEAVAKYALTAYSAMADVYLAESKLALETATQQFAERLEQARFDLEDLKFKFEAALKDVELEISRRKTIGDLQISSAQVHGQLAGSAMSALNSVVSLAVSEEQ